MSDASTTGDSRRLLLAASVFWQSRARRGTEDAGVAAGLSYFDSKKLSSFCGHARSATDSQHSTLDLAEAYGRWVGNRILRTLSQTVNPLCRRETLESHARCGEGIENVRERHEAGLQHCILESFENTISSSESRQEDAPCQHCEVRGEGASATTRS